MREGAYDAFATIGSPVFRTFQQQPNRDEPRICAAPNRDFSVLLPNNIPNRMLFGTPHNSVIFVKI